MRPSRPSAYQLFRALGKCDVSEVAPRREADKRDTSCRRRISDTAESISRPLAPYQRCTCGVCRECRDNAKWDRIFKKFEAKQTEVRGLFQCALNDL
jgi:hypothetical protein